MLLLLWSIFSYWNLHTGSRLPLIAGRWGSLELDCLASSYSAASEALSLEGVVTWLPAVQFLVPRENGMCFTDLITFLAFSTTPYIA